MPSLAPLLSLLCNIRTYRSWLKSSISLVVVMGLTWVVGVLFFGRDLLAFAYIFTIFVAFQVQTMWNQLLLFSNKPFMCHFRDW